MKAVLPPRQDTIQTRIPYSNEVPQDKLATGGEYGP